MDITIVLDILMTVTHIDVPAKAQEVAEMWLFTGSRKIIYITHLYVYVELLHRMYMQYVC